MTIMTTSTFKQRNNIHGKTIDELSFRNCVETVRMKLEDDLGDIVDDYGLSVLVQAIEDILGDTVRHDQGWNHSPRDEKLIDKGDRCKIIFDKRENL